MQLKAGPLMKSNGKDWFYLRIKYLTSGYQDLDMTLHQRTAISSHLECRIGWKPRMEADNQNGEIIAAPKLRLKSNLAIADKTALPKSKEV